MGGYVIIQELCYLAEEDGFLLWPTLSLSPDDASGRWPTFSLMGRGAAVRIEAALTAPDDSFSGTGNSVPHKGG